MTHVTKVVRCPDYTEFGGQKHAKQLLGGAMAVIPVEQQVTPNFQNLNQCAAGPNAARFHTDFTSKTARKACKDLSGA